MMDKTMIRLSEEIERLREQMHKRSEKVGISHPDIMRLSRKLDKLINQYLYYTRCLKVF
ncbi:aspartyl-phosphate phosphatase Spo0E family protein [Sporomusa sp.]|uniref:aspartyl-phosphate phosphatase Spo0E family protein n=1 Tax=Sporomusa sp. TaxID=2078658 RepID=UPI002C527706|nr:aspartyl-phosphate phosphatase Spo0E family protein [Sporomusa sp.]HWR44664.1 aspartyl-phosphate phosphatase Spo0E family protein [Sporomusa sp.]